MSYGRMPIKKNKCPNKNERKFEVMEKKEQISVENQQYRQPREQNSDFYYCGKNT